MGRPAKPQPEPSPPPATIEVWDERAYLPSTPKRVGQHNNVPSDWTTATIIKRYGIAEHLTVYRSAAGETRRVVRHGSAV
jgi:hypothetical protein